MSPHGRPLRVAPCPPGGPRFTLGRPCEETLPPRSPTACGSLPPEGAAFHLGTALRRNYFCPNRDKPAFNANKTPYNLKRTIVLF